MWVLGLLVTRKHILCVTSHLGSMSCTTDQSGYVPKPRNFELKHGRQSTFKYGGTLWFLGIRMLNFEHFSIPGFHRDRWRN